MEFVCDSCGAEFSEPVACYQQENLDGENGWWRRVEYCCPECGSREYGEVDHEQDNE